jgi:rhodanese-related sulfurtransferase
VAVTIDHAFLLPLRGVVTSGQTSGRTLCRQENEMPTTLKDMVADANAVVQAITPGDARQLVEAGTALVIDVRDAPEVEASGKVQGALHISRGMLEFRAAPASPFYDDRLRPEKTVIVYCASGGRSALAGKALKDLGYPDVRNLGGFKAWVDAGGGIERPIDPGM